TENGLTPGTVSGLHEIWHYTIPSGTGTVTRPVVSDGGVHLGYGCFLTTLDPANGAVRWSQPTGPESTCAAVGTLAYATDPYVVDGAAGPQVRGGFNYDGRPGPGVVQPEYQNTGFDVATGENADAAGGHLAAVRGTSRVTTSFSYTGAATSA